MMGKGNICVWLMIYYYILLLLSGHVHKLLSILLTKETKTQLKNRTKTKFKSEFAIWKITDDEV